MRLPIWLARSCIAPLRRDLPLRATGGQLLDHLPRLFPQHGIGVVFRRDDAVFERIDPRRRKFSLGETRRT